jgi:type I restriction enzyme S subunit
MMFYKENTFQDTLMGKIPRNWKFIKMGDVANVKGRIGWRGLKASEYTAEGPYLIANKHLVNNKIAWDKCDHLSEFRYNESPEIQLQVGDVIVSKDGTIGQPAFLDSLPDRATINSTMMLLRVNNDVLAPEFLFYFLQGPHFRRFLKQKISGTSIPHLFQRDMKELGVLLPSILEQKRIVGVLDVVDSVIARTGEVIAKTERLKKGLMQTLLTRGIGHKEYKQTPIGTTPKTWQAVELKDVVEMNKESRDPSKEMPDETFLYVDIDSVDGTVGKIMNPKKILGKEAPSRARRIIHENDVIMSTVRPYLKAFAIVPRELDNQICSTGFAVLSCGNNILPYFLLNVLFSNQTINQCNRMMVGGQYPALNQSQVSQIKIPLPPLSEQQEIADVFASINRKLELERAEKEKLEKVKRGLMDLLLTGKIRVKVD